jgi:hypothetical protein
MKHGSTHTLKAIEKFALVVLCVTEIQDNESDQNRQEKSHVISLHKGSQCFDDNASGIEARQTIDVGCVARGRIRIQSKNKDPRRWQELVARLPKLSSHGFAAKFTGGHRGVRNPIND